MRHNSATFDRLLSSALATLLTPHKLVGEDSIDWMHRLAKQDLTAVDISIVTRIPLESVEYWMNRNGYVDHS